jgi:hypothetical protein
LPKPIEQTLVLEDFGPLGRAWRETDDGESDRQTLIRDMLDGQYENPSAARRLRQFLRFTSP